jgi:hypothetical protein
MMKYLMLWIVAAIGLLMVWPVLWQTFCCHPRSPVKSGGLFWMELTSRLLFSVLWGFLILAVAYFIMTPRLGFAASMLIKIYFYLLFLLSVVRLIWLFKQGVERQPIFWSVIPLLMLLGFVLLIAWVLCTATRTSPHGVILLDRPFHGKWFAMQAGGNRFVNYHHKVQAQAFAIDFVKLGPDGFSYAGRGKTLEEYHAFNAVILAPVAGRVTACRDDLPDNQPGVKDRDHPTGNFISIQDESGNVILLAHLRHGSLMVKAGELVRKGMQLAHCGNSGNSSEPHLHIQANRPSGEPLTILINDRYCVRGIILNDTPSEFDQFHR